jgi:hypothetical protein
MPVILYYSLIGFSCYYNISLHHTAGRQFYLGLFFLSSLHASLSLLQLDRFFLLLYYCHNAMLYLRIFHNFLI